MDTLDESLILRVIDYIRNGRRFDVRSVVQLMLTCKHIHKLVSSDLIWSLVCSELRDYKQLAAYQISSGRSWIQVYKHRITSIFDFRVMEHPEHNAIAFSIYGNGNCFSELANSSEPTLLSTGIIDMHINDNSIILLHTDGYVLEKMYPPSYVHEFDEFTDLYEVRIPDEISIVRTSPVGSFAISNTGRLYVWTIIDHPITMKKIRTQPLHIKALDVFKGKYDIKSGGNTTCVLYGSEDTPEHVDLPNDQIYLLLLESIMNDDDFAGLNLA